MAYYVFRTGATIIQNKLCFALVSWVFSSRVAIYWAIACANISLRAL
jgi:hypothetical protein